MSNKSGMLKWIIWSLAAFFYFYEILLRVSPSVMIPELMNAFSVDAAALGLLTSCFYYAYAPMQLPVGLLLDRFGAKKLLTVAALICGIGAIIFGISIHFYEAAIGRFLLGFGSSFAFVAMVYVCSHWFDVSKRALLVGLANSIGMIGAFCGQGPLGVVLQKINWRVSLILLGITGFFLAFLVYFIIENEKAKPKQKEDSLTHSLLSGLKSICKSKQTWINACIALLFYMTTSAFGELWGVPFLQSAYGLTKSAAGFAISMIFLGWLAGGPLIGYFSDRVKKRKQFIVLSIFLTICCLMPVIYFPKMPLIILYALLFGIGFFSAGELLNFTLATELNSKEVKGSAIAFTNCIVSFGSGLIQPMIGMLLDLNWSGRKENGIHIYASSDYQIAFVIFPLFLILALFMTFFLKEGKIKEHAVEIKSSD
jgi:MFS family permease